MNTKQWFRSCVDNNKLGYLPFVEDRGTVISPSQPNQQDHLDWKPKGITSRIAGNFLSKGRVQRGFSNQI